MMNRRGTEQAVSTIGVFILVLIAVVVLIYIFVPRAQTVTQTVSPYELRIADQQCVGFDMPKLNPTTKLCEISKTDKDGDCLPDTCDRCVLAGAGTGKTGIQYMQAVGLNQCDFDKDGMPDACDLAPIDPKINSCRKETNGKCLSSPESAKNPPPCVNPEFGSFV